MKLQHLLVLFYFALCSSFVTVSSLPPGIFEQQQITTDSLVIGNIQLNAVKVLLENEQMEEALTTLYRLNQEYEQTKDSLFLIESNIMLADVLRDNGDYVKSNQHFNKSISLLKNDQKALAYIFFKKGGNFQLQGSIDSAQANYEKAISHTSSLLNDDDLKAKVHANLSGIFYLKQEYDQAIAHSEIAANYQKVLGNSEIEAGILNNLGGIHYMLGDYNAALSKFQRALDIVGYGQEDLQKQTRNSAYINMAYAYSGLKNYKKAFEFQDRYFSLNDSLQSEMKYKEIADIESKYQVADKEKETEIERVKRQKAEYLSYGLGFAAFVLLLGAYIFFKLYKLTKKNYKLELQQKQLVHKSNIEKLKSESQFKILAATLDGRLEERKKIASVLHDNVSALLSAANLHLHATKNHLKENTPVEIEKTQQIILEVSEKIRDLSHALVPALLLKFGLSAAVNDLCEKLSNSYMTLTSESKNIERFNQDYEIKIFNILNELLNNILKHSDASIGTIKLEQLEGKLQIVVFDNGKGFDFKEDEEQRGVGLSQVEARVRALKGIIKINSKSKETRIYISVPAHY